MKKLSGLRQFAFLAAVWLAPALAGVWGLFDERARYDGVRRDLARRAEQEARNEAQLVALRLRRQFRDLSFIASGLIGPELPEDLDPATVGLLQRFARGNSELFALNLQTPDGARIVWSTAALREGPITPVLEFTPLADSPDDLLGQDRFAKRFGAYVLTMRHRIAGADGRTRYFLGSPYRLDDLLRNGVDSPFALTVHDLRDGSILGVVQAGGVRHDRAVQVQGAVEVPVAGMPLAVRASWSSEQVWQGYREGLAARLIVRLLLLMALSAAAQAIVTLLRRRERQAAQIERLSRLNSMLAEVNQVLAQAVDERGLTQAICELAVRHADFRLAWIGRPDASGRFQFLAAAGPGRGFVRGLDISADPTVPEGQGSSGRAWRDGTVYFNRSFARTPFLALWREQAEREGLKASAVLPIRRHDRVWAVMTMYAAEEDYFDAQLQRVLLDLAQDVSRGMDLIELRRANQALTDHADAGIALVRERRIEYVNARFAQMFGYDDPAQVRGVGARSMYADEATYARVGAAYAELEKGRSVRMQAMPFARRDGSQLLCDVVGVALGDSGTVWTLTDVRRREYQTAQLRRLSMLNALLAAVNQAAGLAEDTAALYRAVCEACVARAGLSRAWIGRSAGEGRFAVLVASGTAEGGPIDDAADAIGGQAWRQGRALFESQDVGAEAALPLRKDGLLQVVLVMHFDERDVFDEPTRALLLELAAGIERGLQALWQRQRIRQLQRLYRALLAEGDVVLQTRSVDEMMARTCAKLVRDTLFHAVWIGRPGDDGVFRVLARAGSGVELVDEIRVSVDDPVTLVARAWREHSAVHYNDNIERQHDSAWRDQMIRHRWASSLAVPIRRGGRVWAVLAFVAPEPQAFDPESIQVCRRVAALLGHGLDELDLKQNLQRLQTEDAERARRDPLTGLPNRLALEQHLPRAVARARRHGSVAAVCMIDLDDFKPVNDRFGHEAGDVLLRQLGARLQGLLRTTDLIARLGGDEFVVVIEDLDADQPVAQLSTSLDRLHTVVETPFDLGAGRQAAVGMSMGVALYPLDDDEPDALLRRADAAMYQAKAHKIDRARWWRLGVTQPEARAQEARFDPFGVEASRLLGVIQGHLDTVAAGFAHAFYAQLQTQPDTAVVLGSLSDQEFTHLKAQQAGHLRFLLDPATSAEAIERRARELGRVHALTGVSGAWMTQAMSLYRELLRRHLDAVAYTARDRYRALRAADARLQLDVQTELDAMQAVVDAYNAHPARAVPQTVGGWTSLVQAELDALGALPGVQACQLMRPGSDGVFAIEFCAGPAAEGMERVSRTAGLQPRLDPRQPTGQGLIPLAWHSEQVQRSDAYARDPRTALWHGELAALGIRSMVAIPVQGGQGPEFVLAIQGAFPHQFSSSWAQTFCASLQNRWGQIATQTQHRTVPLSVAEASEFRRLLHAGALRMDLQPIVDLHSGRPVKLEALARLLGPDGKVIAPGQFLPALRDADLDVLFRQGLDLSLASIGALRAAGFDFGLSINLAPSTLVHPDCASWVEAALRRHAIAPQALTLELLENQEFAEGRRDEAIAALLRVGVQLAIDDLGAGYSSLKRLASLAFNVIKVDQSLIREIAAQPVKILSLVRTIVQIGRDFERDVVVEGLETPALIEAVVRLGASYGQGYGLARPMPPEAVEAWARGWSWTGAAADEVGSFLGALAYHWGYMHEDDGRYPSRHDDCPLTTFFERRGLQHERAAHWHREVHEAAEPARRKGASQQLVDWLIEQARGEAGAAPR